MIGFVAQLVRALRSHRRGRRFKSCRTHMVQRIINIKVFKFIYLYRKYIKDLDLKIITAKGLTNQNNYKVHLNGAFFICKGK